MGSNHQFPSIQALEPERLKNPFPVQNYQYLTGF